jgi:hypothetical protein
MSKHLNLTQVAFGFEDLKSRDLKNHCWYKLLNINLTTHNDVRTQFDFKSTYQ